MKNKSLKISDLINYNIGKDKELSHLKGGEEGLFCTSGGNCNCGTDSARKNVRKSWRKFNKRCGSSGSTN